MILDYYFDNNIHLDKNVRTSSFRPVINFIEEKDIDGRFFVESNFFCSKKVRNYLMLQNFLPRQYNYRYRFCFFFSSLLKLKRLDFFVRTDRPGKSLRFTLIYFLSNRSGFRCIVKTQTNEIKVVLSVSNLFGSAGFLEREIWDMFGVPFLGNPELRRLLTDYGFKTHPLRKDFPLIGFFEINYGDSPKVIVETPVEIRQQYRVFTFDLDWFNVDKILLNVLVDNSREHENFVELFFRMENEVLDDLINITIEIEEEESEEE